MNKTKKVFTAVNIILIIQLAVMLGLSIGITATVTSSTKKNSIEHMNTIADERSYIIESYVKSAEKTLVAYSNAGEITKVLMNPDDLTAKKDAQKYTEKFSNGIDNLEGIYVSNWNTQVIAHTNPTTVGMITRKDEEPRKALQDAMLNAGSNVYDTGIIISPASQKQIVSMYKAIYDDKGNPIGLVGLGIYTEGLVESLNSLTMQGMENASYSMVNMSDNKYIFNPEKSKVATETDNKELLNICKKYNGSRSPVTGYFEYKSNNEKYVSIFSVMPNRNWLLMIDDTKSEIFSLTKSLRIYLFIFCLFALGFILFFHFLNKRQEETSRKLTTAVQKNAKTKESLNTAIFSDILTEVNNRVSFCNDFEDGKIKNSLDSPYYFAMINISDFSNVNINYGNDAGDAVLISTAERIRNSFVGYNIYRTGSDEFMVAIQLYNDDMSYKKVMSAANSALVQLVKPHNTTSGNVIVNYRMAIVKKSSNINSSVITALKDLTNRNGITNPGQITFVDLDAMR